MIRFLSDGIYLTFASGEPFRLLAWYGVIIMLGAVAGAWLAAREVKRRGGNPELVVDLLIYLIIGGVIGARLWHVFTPPPSSIEQGYTTVHYLTNLLDLINLRKGGLGIPGAVIGGAIALYFYTRKHKLSFAEWADIAAPSLALGQAVGRWGNYINQELYGAPTNLPWRIFIDPAHRVRGFENFEYFHPLFLYESFWNLANMFFLMWLSRRFADRLKPGDVLLAYLVAYPIGRFLLDFLRLDAAQIIPKIKSSNGFTHMLWYYLVPLPTYSRVTGRTITTGSTSYTYSYEYTGAVTNRPNASISVAAAGPHPYIKPYTEFRGHSQVVETNPYGGQTITKFYRDDIQAGLAYEVIVKDGNGKIVQKSSTSYDFQEWVAAILTSEVCDEAGCGQPYDQLYIRWVKTVSDTNGIYVENNQSTPSASLTTTYDTYDAYGNLRQKTVSGTDIDTLTTIINYSPNVSGGKWLVGLPSRVYVQKDGVTRAISINLYDYHNLYNDAPSDGRLTGTRTWVNGSQYIWANLHYDDYGNVDTQTSYSEYGTVSVAPPSGAQTTSIVYDSIYHTYPISITNALGHITTLTYDFTLGVPLSETGPNGAATKVDAEYDAFGRLIKLIRPNDTSASPTLVIDYNDGDPNFAAPFIVTLTQKINDTQSYEIERQYDGMGRPSLVITNGSILVNYSYGYENGVRVDKQSAPHTSAETAYESKVTYDSLGRPSIAAAPDGNITTYTYNGLIATATDANGNVTSTTTDILGRTTFVNAPIGPDITLDYDELGNLTSTSRGNGVVVMTYDRAGRKISMNDSDMGIWTYTYDALGNLKTQTDSRSCVFTMTYDVLNRLDTRISSGSGCVQQINVDYDYDSMANGGYGKGFRTSMTDGSSTNPTRWEYDERGRLRKEIKRIDTQTFNTSFTYNSADLPVIMTYPDGEAVTNTYDERMMLETVIGNNAYVSNINYDSAGRMKLRALGNGKTQNFTYYDWNEKVNNIGQGGRLESIVTGGLQNLTYQYDAVGNVMQIQQVTNFYTNPQQVETQTFGYDDLNRLTSWQVDANPSENYSYDTNGNLGIKNGLDINYYDTTSVHAATHIGTTQKYWYDENGNQVTRVYGGDTYTQIYDAENRMVEVKKGSTTVAQFVYNGDGQRVKSVIGSETIYFAGGHYEKKGSQVTKYYFAGASRIAMRKYTVPASMTVEYFLGDHLGSTSVTTDNAGVKVSEMRYKPWGEVRYSWTSSQSTTPAYTLPKYTFTGQYSYMDDPSTQGAEGFGLMFYNARWYDPMTGRMIQADSIVPNDMQGLDRYLYTANNPVRYTDPSGHDWTDCGNRVKTRCEIHMRKVKQAFEKWEEEIRVLLYLSFNNPDNSSYRTAALNAIASYYGIHLAGDDRWLYMNFVGFGGGGENVYGWTPRRQNEIYFDVFGMPQHGEDKTVVITSRTFEECGLDASCVAWVMAHEATHSWLEYKVEHTPGAKFTSDDVSVEEMVADSVALWQIGTSTQLAWLPQQHYNYQFGLCLDRHGPYQCSAPFPLLQSLYNLDISEISNWVFHGGY